MYGIDMRAAPVYDDTTNGYILQRGVACHSKVVITGAIPGFVGNVML